MTGTPQYLTTGDLAELLRTTEAAIHTRRWRGDLPAAIRIGRRVLFDLADVERWLDEHKESR